MQMNSKIDNNTAISHLMTFTKSYVLEKQILPKEFLTDKWKFHRDYFFSTRFIYEYRKFVQNQ